MPVSVMQRTPVKLLFPALYVVFPYEWIQPEAVGVLHSGG